jgi:hypothetical protein
MFLEKTIENWLTKTNEIGYQLPFCQVLLGEEFSICHISKHNAFEQGKDIIAVDSNGDPHVFQLKRGNITSAKWRDEVKAEIEKGYFCSDHSTQLTRQQNERLQHTRVRVG